MFDIGPIHPESTEPLYRQIAENFKRLIAAGKMAPGSRLPATRELAGQLGLNRATVSAAYEVLESEGFITGQVGRGSFVSCRGGAPAHVESTGNRIDWRKILDHGAIASPAAPASTPLASFASSRPSEFLFPLDEFRATCEEVIRSPEAQTILQLGPPGGYPPLRRYLLERAQAEGVARASDDILITNGCQQSMSLLENLLVRPGDTILLEDPVYLGMKNVFERSGARLAGVPVGPDGIDITALERIAIRERPRLLAVTPNFQNPTGATLPLASRQSVIRIARAAG